MTISRPERELFKIGVGPSSSHTVGLMVAARRFTVWLDEQVLLGRTGHVEADLCDVRSR